MNATFDVIIIGGGVIGASIFYHLAQQGYQVALIEKKTIASGCTTWSGGIVRCFHLDSILTDRALYSWEYYLDFKKNTGIHCEFHQSGFIFIPKKTDKDIASNELNRLSRRISHLALHKSEIERQFAGIFKQVPEYAIYEPQAGYLCPISVTLAWIAAGRSHGGKICEHTTALSITEEDNTLHIKTSRGNMLTKKIVIAAGSSSPHLLNQFGYPHQLTVKNIHMDIRRSTHSISHPAYVDEETNLYGRSDIASGAMYIGLPTNKQINDVFFDTQHSSEIYEQGLRRFSWVRNSELLGSLSDRDAFSKDGRGCVTTLNSSRNIFLASGFSGGGFKQAPWVGNEILQLIKKSESFHESK